MLTKTILLFENKDKNELFTNIKKFVEIINGIDIYNRLGELGYVAIGSYTYKYITRKV